MKKAAIIFFLATMIFGCARNAPVVVENSNSAPPNRNDKLQSVISHTTENQTPPAANSAPPAPGERTKWSQGGSAIDTAKFDADIAAAEKALKAKPGDAKAKETLADYYYIRGNALTEAKQYASALGDFRRAVKLDPSNEEAKGWIDQIINIYNSMNKEYPKEGEEPPPLPFKKEEK